MASIERDSCSRKGVPTARVSALAAGIIVLGGSIGASAGMVEDCIGSDLPPASRGKACNALIESGKYQGAELSKFYIVRGRTRPPSQEGLAIADLTKAIELDAKNVDAYNGRGKLYGQQRDYEKALADYSKVIELDDKQTDAYRYRADRYRQSLLYKNPPPRGGEAELALADYGRIIDLGKADPFVFEGRASVYSAINRHTEAIADYDKAISMKPEYWQYYHRAQPYFELGKLDKSLEDLDQALKLSPNFTAALMMRAEINELLGRKPEAIADHRSVLKLSPGSRKALEGLKRLGVDP